MMLRKVFTGLIFLGLAAKIRSHVEMEAEDYFFPLEPVINFCKLADQCTHDFVIVCGQDSMGLVKFFIDNCDLYEFDCDEKKQYRHVEMSRCSFLLESEIKTVVK